MEIVAVGLWLRRAAVVACDSRTTSCIFGVQPREETGRQSDAGVEQPDAESKIPRTLCAN